MFSSTPPAPGTLPLFLLLLLLSLLPLLEAPLAVAVNVPLGPWNSRTSAPSLFG